MASLRKKYSTYIDGPRQDAPPVTTAPSQGAQPPEPAADAKPPPEQPDGQSPADAAASSAIKDRLDEMIRAEGLQREAQQQQQRPQQPPPQPQRAAEPPLQELPPITAEQIIAGANIPELAKDWLRKHPEYVLEPVKNNTLIALHDVAARRCGSEFTNEYFNEMDDLLGLAPRTNGHVESRPAPQPTSHAPRPAAPARPMAAPVSAPPTREVPSYATGRAPTYRAPLNKDELEIAAASGMTPEQYQQKKELWQKMKAEGHQ